MPIPSAAQGVLVGRTAELDLIGAAIDAVEDNGSVLVFRGEAGIGKSVLLDAARDTARSRGLRVLSTVGAEAESGLPYSSLHRLIRPLLGDVDRLPAPQRSMLLSAFGMGEHQGGDLFLVALAALGLVGAEATRQPLLITVDDLQWLDEASREVITFVARRVESDPVVLIGAIRAGHLGPAERLGLPEHVVDALDASASRALLDARVPDLAPPMRSRLLAEAGGNPLGLVELPAVVEQLGVSAETDILPVSSRLERAFADRARHADPDTRMLLLVFAADITSSLAEVLAAGAAVLGRPLTVDVLQPALDAGLLKLDGTALEFRHPLVRSAIYQAASAEQQRTVHAALADVVAGQPDRRAQHRAAAAAGPDDEIAQELEDMGLRALGRGAAMQASAALTHAARLSIDPEARVRRLLGAAEPAFEAGRADLVRDLVDQARRESLSEHDSARVEWLSEIFHDGSGPGQGDASRVLHLVSLATRAGTAGEEALALALMMAAGLRCWWADSAPEVRQQVVVAVDDLHVSPTDPRRIATIALADPLGQARQLSALIAELATAPLPDARLAHLLGLSGHAIGDYESSLRLFAVASDRLRDEGRLALLAQTLVMRSVELIILGDFTLAAASAEEARRLAEETYQPIWLAGATGSLAALAALHGELERARELCASAVTTLDGTGTNAVAGWLQVARGVIELSAGRYEEAYAHLVRIFDPGDPAHHLRDQFLGVGLFVDAAVGCDAIPAARRIIASLEQLAGDHATTGVGMGLLYAKPLLATDEEAEAAFRAALAARWSARPFDRARLQLAYGMWLRRQRRVVESREPLRLARGGFDALNLPAWSARARQELRAAGETSTTRERQAWDDLSPQEMQIAQLAAAGLTNREIGHRLYLSPRTVATHLYHAYPKLGITSRAQLNAVLPASAPTTSKEASR